MKQSIGYKSEKKEEASENSEVKDNFNRSDETVNIRKISNGFIVSKSWTEGKGDKKQYKNEDIYYEKNPL